MSCGVGDLDSSSGSDPMGRPLPALSGSGINAGEQPASFGACIRVGPGLRGATIWTTF